MRLFRTSADRIVALKADEARAFPDQGLRELWYRATVKEVLPAFQG